MQHKIFLTTKKCEFFLRYYYQRLLVSSLFFRIKAIEEILKENYHDDFLTLEEKFQIIYNLNYLNTYNYNKYFILKDKGLSFYYDSINLYYAVFQSVWNYAILPFTETNLSKHSFNFRPFRNHYDFLIELKKIFSKEINKETILLKIKAQCLWNIKTNFWIMKNFPFLKKILKNIIIKKSGSLNSEHNIYVTLINYMLNSLVCIG